MIYAFKFARYKIKFVADPFEKDAYLLLNRCLCLLGKMLMFLSTDAILF